MFCNWWYILKSEKEYNDSILQRSYFHLNAQDKQDSEGEHFGRIDEKNCGIQTSQYKWPKLDKLVYMIYDILVYLCFTNIIEWSWIVEDYHTIKIFDEPGF